MKMIKTTPKLIRGCIGSLNELSGSALPVKAAYSVSKLIAACNSELRDFEAARNKIFADAGCTINDKTQWTHENLEVLEAKKKVVEELLDVETEINALPLDIEQFGSATVPGGVFAELFWALKPEA